MHQEAPRQEDASKRPWHDSTPPRNSSAASFTWGRRGGKHFDNEKDWVRCLFVSEFLLQCEDVLAINALVAHLVHNLTDEEDAQATDLAVVHREGDVGLGSLYAFPRTKREPPDGAALLLL